MNSLAKKFLEKWILYLYSALAFVIGGAAHSLAPMFVDPTKFNLSDGLQNVGKVALCSAFISLITYLMKSPIPSLPKGFGEETEIPIKQTTNEPPQ